MRVVAVVSENPSLAQSILTAGLTEQAHQTSRLPVTLIRLHADETTETTASGAAPSLGCRSLAEMGASLQQLRYAGAEWVFVDCRLAFGSIADALMAAVDLVIVPVAARRRELDLVSGITAAAKRHDKPMAFALIEQTPSSKATAAYALALSRFAPVVALANPAACPADGANAELLRTIHRLIPSEATTATTHDWPVTLWRDDGETVPCRLAGIDAEAWHLRSAASLAVNEAVTLTVSVLGRLDATVAQITEDGAVVHPQADAARQHRLATRIAARIAKQVAEFASTPAPLVLPAEPVVVDDAPVKRRTHALLHRIAAVPGAHDRLRGLNRIVAEHGHRGQRTPGRIIVVGNEKGGSGKSTLTIHLVVALLKEGFDVATVDLDHRQGSLTRYLDNRRVFAEKNDTPLVQPSCHTVVDGDEDELRFSNLLTDLSRNRDFVVLDTPGHDQPLSRLAHLFADKVITPINDSFLDLDVIARLDPDTVDFIGPSHYGQVILQAREERGSVNGSPDWIVIRNRLSTVLARNKVDMAAAVERLSQQMGFRVGPGLTERVIYRELFPFGLTLLDLREQGVGVSMTMSHVAARQELRALLQLLLPATGKHLPTSHAQHNERKPSPLATDSEREVASTQIDAIFADTPRAVEYVNAG